MRILALLSFLGIGFVVWDKIKTKQDFGVVAFLIIGLLFAFALFCLWSRAAWKRPGSRARVMKLWTIGVMLGLGFVFTDVVLGKMLIHSGSPTMEPDLYVHHKQRPNQVFHDDNGYDLKATRHINGMGLRGPEVASPKPADVYRILMLGDSMTAGKGVEDNQTYSALLQTKLQAPAGKRIEVVNCGVDSYSPILSYMQYKHYLSGLGADMVVYNYDMSDLVQNALYLEKGELDEKGELTRFKRVHSSDDGTMYVPGSKAKAVRNWVDNHMYLTRFVFFKLDQMRGKRGDGVERANTEILDHTVEGDSVDRSAQWEGVFRYIRKLRSDCEAKGVKFILTATPWPHQVSDDEFLKGRDEWVRPGKASVKSIDRTRDFAAKEGMVFYSLLEPALAFKKANPGVLLYFKTDMHPTPKGHEVYADFLAPLLQKAVSG